MPAELTGVEAAQAAIQGVADDARNMADVHALIAQAGVDGARARAPTRTGRLVGSIAGQSDNGQARLAVGVAYWPYQEFGTRVLQGRHYLAAGVRAMSKTADVEYPKRLRDGYKRRV